MNRPPDTFVTQRLVGRPSRLEQAPELLRGYASDPEVTRFISWSPNSTLEWMTSYLRKAIEEWESGTCFRYELFLLETGESVGAIRLRMEGPKVLVSFILARPHWGRGLIAEALQFTLDWMLAQPEIFRVYAYCDVENVGSSRVMEKAGMMREGLLRRWFVCPNIGPEPRDSFIYAKVR